MTAELKFLPRIRGNRPLKLLMHSFHGSDGFLMTADDSCGILFQQFISWNIVLFLFPGTVDIGNMVFTELRRSTEHICYYKTANGDEIDFAVGPDSDIQLIQVCWELGKESNTRKREFGALFDGMDELGLQESWIITAYEAEEIEDAQTGRTIHVVPAYSWLLENR